MTFARFRASRAPRSWPVRNNRFARPSWIESGQSIRWPASWDIAPTGGPL